MKKILFYGYGNPGRQDDGLGIAFAEALEKFVREQKYQGISFDSNYQLNIEDADTIKKYDLVFFCDASREDIGDFCITKVKPSDAHVEFTMHAVSPAYVLDLCRKIFGKNPDTYLIHIKGYAWEFQQQLSNGAKANLRKAVMYFQKLLPELLDEQKMQHRSMPECMKIT